MSYTPPRQPHPPGIIEFLPSDFTTTGAGVFAFSVDTAAGRILAEHQGLGLAQIGNLFAVKDLPDDFMRFETNALVVITRRNGATTLLTISLSVDGSLDATINAVDIKPTANLTYEERQLTPGTVYTKGDKLMIQIISQASALQANQIASLKMFYTRRA